MKKIILIPAYEPDEKLIKLLKEINDNNSFDTVVVNDGSSKDKNEIFKQAEKFAVVLGYDENKGKGAALKTGIKYISENYNEDFIVATVDSDGQHSLSDTIKVVDVCEKNPDSLVIGSRVFKGKIPLRSIMGNYITRFVYNLISGVNINDTQTGLRAFSSKLIPFMLSVKGDRYEYEMNVLIECAGNDILITEAFIQAIYIQNNESSHFDTLKDSIRIYKHILKYSVTNILCPVLNFILFCIFIYLTRKVSLITSVLVSNILCSLISFCLDYYLNKRKYINKKYNKNKKKFSYIFEFVFHLIISTAFLILISLLIKNKIWAKVIVEVILFIISFAIHNLKVHLNHNT